MNCTALCGIESIFLFRIDTGLLCFTSNLLFYYTLALLATKPPIIVKVLDYNFCWFSTDKTGLISKTKKPSVICFYSTTFYYHSKIVSVIITQNNITWPFYLSSFLQTVCIDKPFWFLKTIRPFTYTIKHLLPLCTVLWC